MKVFQPTSLIALLLIPLQSATAGSKDHGGLMMEERTSLGFSFFPDVMPREATDKELDGLMSRTSQWFLEQLQQKFPGLESFQATHVVQHFDVMEPQYPVKIDFDADAEFKEQGAKPTSKELISAMQSLDFESYITDAVSTETKASGIFEEVQTTTFVTRTRMDKAHQRGRHMTVAIDTPPIPDCGSLLKAYRDSFGETWTQVPLVCLESPSCAPGEVTLSGSEHIACNFTEHTSRSEWSNCETTESEETVELGNLWNVASPDDVANDWTITWPVIQDLTGYKESQEWGITKGCGDDNYVYLLYRNGMEAAEGLYDVVGYQPLDAFLQNGEFVHGLAGVEGRGISGIAVGECAYGWQYMTELLGSCKVAEDAV